MSIRAQLRNIEKQQKIAQHIEGICESLIKTFKEGTLSGVTTSQVSEEDAATLAAWCEANGLEWTYVSGEFTTQWP